MLIVAGTFTSAPGAREQVLDHAGEAMAATRQEEGCHSYVFSPDVDDPNLIRLYELWEGEEELNAHLQTAHIAEFRQATEGLIVGRSVHIFTVTERREL